MEREVEFSRLCQDDLYLLHTGGIPEVTNRPTQITEVLIQIEVPEVHEGAGP